MTSVSVHAQDRLAGAGLLALLAREPRIQVVPPSPPRGRDPAPDVVAVVLLESVEKEELGRLRRLVIDRNGKVVLVVRHLDDPGLGKVLDTGVHSIIWRDGLSAWILAAVVGTVARGGGEVPADLVPRLADQVRRARRQAAVHGDGTGFTEREAAVLKLISEGWGTKDIADQMAYSERTVKGLLHDLMTRRRFRNRTHAVAVAMRDGYI